MVQITDAGGAAVELGDRPPTRLTEFEAVAVIDSKTIVAEGVAELLLRRKNGQPWPKWNAGSHIDFVMPNGLERQYSLCGVEGDPDLWRIGILRDPNGRGGSAYIHDTLSAGDEIEVRGPRNHFRLNNHDSYLFIAGGIGITPILAMIKEVNARGKKWSLIYGGRTRASMAFLDEIQALDGEVGLYPQDEVGHIPLPALLGTPDEGVGIYACGPGPMLNAVEVYHDSWPVGAIHMERFVAVAVDTTEDKPIEVYLEASDITIEVAADESILTAVEREGIQVLSSCRVGTCGTCETPLLEGTPDHRDAVLDDEDKERNDCMMICVSRALSKRIVLDL